MRKRFVVAGVVLVALAAYAGAFVMLNRNPVANAADIERREGAAQAPAGDALNVMIWNLGYGGLGKDSDFVADGGTHTFPPSRDVVRTNNDGIAATLARFAPETDVIIHQEIAHGGPVNYWVDLKARVDRELAGYNSAFFADFHTRLMPWPLTMKHGQAIYARGLIDGVDVVPLPAEDTAIFGVKRRYASLVARIPIEGREHGWTIASVHLAAFDPDAAVRTRQLRELLAWAEREYASGQHVVLGGDWNFQIAETNFPNTTEERFLFWLFPFPQDALPEGWRIAADARVPSVRTNYQAYVPGENYTTTIDGFIVSPNVTVENVEGVDLGFTHSDHQPVRIRVRAAPAT